jgi:hypothetical protein
MPARRAPHPRRRRSRGRTHDARHGSGGFLVRVVTVECWSGVEDSGQRSGLLVRWACEILEGEIYARKPRRPGGLLLSNDLCVCVLTALVWQRGRRKSSVHLASTKTVSKKKLSPDNC